MDVDIVLLLDSSNAINKKTDWPKIKVFFQDLAERLSISKENVQLASVQFGGSASKVNWKLNNFIDNNSIREAIGELQYSVHDVSFKTGIHLVKNDVFVDEHGDRPEAANFILLITSSNHIRDLSYTLYTDDELRDIATVVPISIGTSLSADDYHQVEQQHPFLLAFNNTSLLNDKKNVTLGLVCNTLTLAYFDAVKLPSTITLSSTLPTSAPSGRYFLKFA